MAVQETKELLKFAEDNKMSPNTVMFIRNARDKVDNALKEFAKRQAEEKEAEEARKAQEGAGPANICDRGAAPSWAIYPPSWEAFRGDPDANGFFQCSVCGVKKQDENALQNHVWAKANDDKGHPLEDVQERWYPEWKSGSAKQKQAKKTRG